MTFPDRCLLALFCFLFLSILYGGFMAHECNPYKAECKPDTVIQYVSPCVDSATTDRITWRLETINP